MKNHSSIIFLLIILLIFQACTSPKYFYDESSYKRQKELRDSHSSNIFEDIMTGFGCILAGAVLETEIEFAPTDQQFKKLKLTNITGDTMYVNMLTDVYWDANNYCDFMDIRIPPHEKCKVMVPIDASYNLYFSTTARNDDDEMLEIFTTDIKKISLYPGITTIKDTINAIPLDSIQKQE